MADESLLDPIAEAPRGARPDAAPVDRPSPAPAWPLGTRLLFRFAFVWFLLWVLQPQGTLLPIGRIGELGEWLTTAGAPEGEGVESGSDRGGPFASIGAPLAKLPEQWMTHLQKPIQDRIDRVVVAVANWRWVTRWTERTEPFTERPSGMGSGDTTCDWVEAWTLTGAALLAAALWSVAAGLLGRGAHHRRLHDAWRVLLRFELATWLVLYGVIKIIPSQMPLPDLDRLCEPVGEMSPMGMLWTFLGSSPAYETFSGAAELAAAWLLVTRATTTLGALATIAVMGNVFVMNMCYDVPVKIFSCRLMLQGVALAAPALPRLWRAMVLQQAVPAQPHGALFPWRFANRCAFACGLVLVGEATWSGIASTLEQRDVRAGPAAAAARSPFEGIWVMKQFEFDGAPAVGDEDLVWRRLVIGNSYRLALETNGVPFRRYFTQLDMATKSALTLQKRGDPNWKSVLRLERETDDLLSVTGEFDGHEIWVQLRKVATPDYPLMKRGFHWANEYPNNH